MSGIAINGYQTSYGGGARDGFLVKFDSSGIQQWGTYYGGESYDDALDCVTDGKGNVYLAGLTRSRHNIAAGGFRSIHGGHYDGFLVKFDSSGIRRWGTYYGGNGEDVIGSCAIDLNDNVYAGGGTHSASLIAYNGHQMTYGGRYDSFLAKFGSGKSLLQRDTVGEFACDFYDFNGDTLTASGIYSDTLLHTASADSVITLDLIISYSSMGIDTQVACTYYIWINGNMYFYSNNTATTVLPNAAGCDSVVTLDLTINTVNTNVTPINTTLTADAAGASYQWTDCNNGNAPITGAIAQSFTPSLNGDYAVVVTENTCTDTSACFNVIVIGVDQVKDPTTTIQLYPNPTRSTVTVDLGRLTQNTTIALRDLAGQLIQTQHYDEIQQTQWYLDYDLPKGIYLLSVQIGDQDPIYFKLIKQ